MTRVVVWTRVTAPQVQALLRLADALDDAGPDVYRVLPNRTDRQALRTLAARLRPAAAAGPATAVDAAGDPSLLRRNGTT